MHYWEDCTDLGEPKLWICLSLDHWCQHEAEIRAWFGNEGAGVGQVFGQGAVYINSDHEALFMLRFGP